MLSSVMNVNALWTAAILLFSLRFNQGRQICGGYDLPDLAGADGDAILGIGQGQDRKDGQRVHWS